jgi:type I restriction enzyme S subunit
MIEGEELPEGWIGMAFDELNTFKSQTINPSDYPQETFELYSVPTFPTRKPELLTGSEIGSTKQAVEPGDVLVCKINPRINRVWKVLPRTDKRQIASSEWIVMRASGMNPEFLRAYFRSQAFREILCEDLTGVGGSLTRAQPKRVAKLRVPIAPLAEQKRIADKLEALLGRVEACRARLDRVPDLLKRFRQSVLAAATSGRLTEDWREENASHDDWSEVKLEEVAVDFSYGSSSKSTGVGAIPVLRMGNIQSGKLVWNDLVYTSNKDEIVKFHLSAGDVLFNRTNSPELVGKTAVYKGERSAIFAGYLIRVRCSRRLLPDYINYCLNSPAGRDYCWQVKTDGVSQSNINAKKLAAFAFQLPPLPEQAEIVRRVEALFALAGRIEARVEAARAQVDRLTPAILAKAFRGELVPQDPADEPASVLLERLQQKPAAAKSVRRGRRTSQKVVAAPAAQLLSASETRAKPLDAGAPSTQAPVRSSSPAPDRRPRTPAHHAAPRAASDKNELMAVLRAVVGEQGSCDRATAMKLTAHALGSQRVGKVVGAEIDNALRTAVRRSVLFNDGDQLRVNPASLAQMAAEDREFLKTQFLAALSQNGRVWVERDDAPRLLATWFGFQRASPQIQETAKSLINGLIRENRLEAQGTCIRRFTP